MSVLRTKGLGVLSVVFAFLVLSGCESDSESGADGEPTVLVVTLDSIHRVSPPVPPRLIDRHSSLQYGLGYVFAMNFNYANKSLCYIQRSRPSSFKCASVDDLAQRWELPKPTLFPEQIAVTSIAYDWASGVWYFADKQQRCIYVCDGALRQCRMLHRDVEDPRALAVDPTPPAGDNQTAGFIFWSQNNTTPARLVRSDLAGGDVTGLLPRDCPAACACTPKALTLDVEKKLVFWVDGETDTVEQCNYDGSARTTVYKIIDAYQKDIKVFSRFQSTLYLPGYRSVLTVAPNSTDTIPVYGFPSITAVFHQTTQPKVSHPCAKNNGGCEHICVTGYRGATPKARCLCRHGYELNSTEPGACSRIPLDTFLLVSRGAPPMVEVRGSPLSPALAAAPVGGTWPTVADVDLESEYIYISDVYENRIIRQKLDGSGRNEFVMGDLGECQGLAVDWMGGNLYFTDIHVGTVSVARMAAPARRRVLLRNGLHPHSIALDPKHGVMYWTVWARAASSASIETANMDGSERRTLVTGGMESPSGLLIDTDNEVLYWCDTKLNKIETLELASNQRSTILSANRIDQPYGLALFDGYLMWSEQGSGQLWRLSLSKDGNGTQVVDSVTPPLFSIRLVSRSARTGRNNCSEDNGGCAELCLATPGGRACACATGRFPRATEPTLCQPDGA